MYRFSIVVNGRMEGMDWVRTSQKRTGQKRNSLRRLKSRQIDWKFWKWDRDKLMKRVAIGLAGTMIGSMLLLAIMMAWFSKDLPSPGEIKRREGFSTQILAREGEVLYDVSESDERREPVSFEEIPEYLKQATVAVEDKNFYGHSGFDLLGMVRGFSKVFFGRRVQGGSTLTQQLVKNVLLSSERTVIRKLKEFVLAVQIERKFTKDEILQMYLQEAPYGGTAIGAKVASRVYFSKELDELNLVESAFLAGMPQAPTRYSPYGVNSEAWKGRTAIVLERMKGEGYISKDEEQEAIIGLDELEFRPQGGSIQAPHFVMYVRSLLAEQFGEEVVNGGGLKVTTTLDLELQEAAQDIVAEEIEKVESLGIGNGAAIVLEPNMGEVLAMVGSKDFFAEDYDGEVNVVLSQRQPGSAIKPITYLTAFKKGYSPAYTLVDVETEFAVGGEKSYKPVNYDGEFRGPVQVRFALGSSLNIPAVKMLQLVGLKDMLQVAYELGLDTLEPSRENMSRFGLSVALGGGEVRLIDLASAYSAFANAGEKISPVAITKVEDARGKTIWEYKEERKKQVMSEEEAYLINHILSDNNARLLTFGANSYLNMGSEIAVKTGTTNDKRDNWTIGWSDSVLVGVWVGNNDNSPMKEVASGVSGASPIWRNVIREALAKYPAEGFEKPDGIETMEVDAISGYPEHDGFAKRTEYFIKGTVPSGEDLIHFKAKVCKGDQGKLANDLMVSRGDYDEKEVIWLLAPEVLPEAVRINWQTGMDAWASGQGDERYHRITEYCSESDDWGVNLKQPENHKRYEDGNIDWKAEIVGAGEVEWAKLIIDGSVKQTLSGKPWEGEINLSQGSYTVKVKVRLKDGEEKESGEHKIGVGQEWDYQSPTPIPTPAPITPTAVVTPDED